MLNDEEKSDFWNVINVQREICIHVANLCIYERDNPDPWKTHTHQRE